MDAGTENVQQPFRYMGRELDPITGLYYVRNRWYNPVAARFVSEDPIGLPKQVDGRWLIAESKVLSIS